jgi:hypothetical protein
MQTYMRVLIDFFIDNIPPLLNSKQPRKTRVHGFDFIFYVF